MEYVAYVPFHFNMLQTLTLDGFNKYQDHLMDFVMQNKNLTKQSMVPYMGDFDDVTIGDIGTIVAALPKLIEYEFCAELFSKDEIVLLLNDNKMLEKVQLLFDELPSCPYFQFDLKKEWNLVAFSVSEFSKDDIIYYGFNLERKH